MRVSRLQRLRQRICNLEMWQTSLRHIDQEYAQLRARIEKLENRRYYAGQSLRHERLEHHRMFTNLGKELLALRNKLEEHERKPV